MYARAQGRIGVRARHEPCTGDLSGSTWQEERLPLAHKARPHQHGGLCQMACECMARGLPAIEQVDSCVSRASPSREADAISGPGTLALCWRAERSLELVHGDLCRPVAPATRAGTATPCFSSTIEAGTCGYPCCPQRIKWQQPSRTSKCARTQILAASRWHSAQIMAGSSPRLEYCTVDGVRRMLTALYSCQQNDDIERQNELVVGTARSLYDLHQAPRAWNKKTGWKIR